MDDLGSNTLIPQITSNVAEPANEATVWEVERQLSLRLPADYRLFLLRNNGGQPNPKTVPTPTFPPSADTYLHRFFGIGAFKKCYDVLWNYQMRLHGCPAKLLPIACDEGGSEFCISTEGTDLGAIYYFDYYHERQTVPTRYPWAYAVAATLPEFLETFYEYVDPNETAELRAIRKDDVSAFTSIVLVSDTLNAMDADGLTKLENAAIYGALRVAELLLRAGAEVRESRVYAERNNHAELVALIDSLRPSG